MSAAEGSGGGTGRGAGGRADWREAVERLSTSADPDESRGLVEVLVREFQGPVMAAALQIAGGERALAEDIFQETFVKLIESRRHIRAPVAFPRFLRVVTLNVARDLLRRRQRVADAAASTPDPEALSGPDFAETVSLFETRLYVQAYLEKLEGRQRDVLVAKFFRGESDPAAALRLGISPENLRVLRHRAMEKLRELIAGDGL